MSQPINIQDSLVVNPSGIDTSQSSYSTGSNNANAYDDITSTTYSTLSLNTGSNASSYVTYTFDTSELPANATLDSISCVVKARISSTSYISTATLQLYSGTTAKGSTTSFRSTSTTTTYTLTPGTWTKAELANIRVRATATRGTSNTSRSAYIYFYGANLTINYSIQGIQYTLTASSEVSGVTVDPIATTALGGEDREFIIDPGDVQIEDIIVEDNGVDVTDQLLEFQEDGSGEISAIPGSNVTTGFSDSGGAFYQSSSTTSDSWLRYAIGHSAENPYSTTNTSNTYVKGSASGNTTTGWMNYPFDFSEIPSNATITSISVRCYGARENATVDTTHVCHVGLYSGSTLKSTQQNFTSTSNGVVTITSPGTWTRAELQNAQLRFTIGYYGGRLLGVTWEVEYTVPVDGYYYKYTLTNINNDHVIVISQAGAFVPPEEDPQYTYYPITISSINANTNPADGTIRVQEGTNQTITITPTDPQLTLALDNGVDITNQLVGGVPTNTYEVDTQATGASYGFNLNSSTGYYVSTNNGTGSSASVARVTFDLESDVLVTIQYINQGESQCDYGMFGKIDTTVSTTGNTYASSSASPDDPSNYYYMCAAAADSTTTVKTLTYEISAGEHYIDIKYAKDQASDSGNDSLQWKILSIEATSAGGEYTYTLSNIQQRHNLIFIFGNVSYYFVTSSGTNSRLYPDGQIVVLDGDDYHLTIVPDDAAATVTLLDNNVNRTSVLEYETTTDKYGNPVANYTYRLTNITAAHTITVTCTSATSAKIYLKVNGSWVEYSKVYVKVNGSWVEQDPSTWTSLFDTRTNYRKGN